MLRILLVIFAVAVMLITCGLIVGCGNGGNSDSAVAPVITSFTPTSGLVGREVTITGANFTGATSVEFHATVASSFTVVNDTTINATVPVAATSGSISIATDAGTAISTAAFTVTTPPAPPTISDFTPQAMLPGAVVMITGTNLTGATAVMFNGIAATSFTVVSATSITATAPAGVTAGKITVTTGAGTATSVSSFTLFSIITGANPTDNAAMVWVPGATFTMGSKFTDYWVRRTQQVTLSGYWIYKYDVTVAQYRAFCTATGHALPPFPSHSNYPDSPYIGYSWAGKTGWNDAALQQHPIVNVSWLDAKAYADWAGVKLPTEAQWEYAAAGPQGNNYPWGGTATSTDNFNGWDATKCANQLNSYDVGISTWPVGSFPAGASWCGAQDMAGNVWQWCADWIASYSDIPVTDPTGPATGDTRVKRGGFLV